MLALARTKNRRVQTDYQKQVIGIVFDQDSAPKIRPGLKLIFAQDEMPLCVDYPGLDEFQEA